MSTLTIRNVEPVIKDKLRLAAAAHGRSMEEEVRRILRRIHARFAALGGIDLALPERSDLPRAASFDENASQ